MKVRNCMLAVATMGLVPLAAWAQEKDPRINPPVAPIGAESTSKATGTTLPPPAQTPSIEKDSLSGSHWGLGSLGGSRSYLLPRFSFFQGADMETKGPNQTNAQTQVNTGLKLRKEWKSYMVDVDYSLGGVVYNTQSNQSGLVQGLSLGQTISLNRWSVSVFDSFSYLPESGFGAPLLGNVGQSSFGGGVFNSNPLLNPTQTILTGQGKRISNSVLGQVQYDFNRQLSFTGSASYSILRFLDNSGGFLENNNIGLQAGMDYKITRFDTLATTYSLQHVRFHGVAGGFEAHTVHLVYGRRITGRLSMNVGAGPQIRHFHLPGQTINDRVSWSTNTRLLYAMRNMDLGLTYSHSITSGSGVLLGATTDSLEGTLTRQLFRNWTTSWGAGYARNESLRQLTGGPSTSLFKTWRANATIGRSLGRSLQMNASYSFQSQDQALCGGGLGCMPGSQRHVFGVMFSWRFNQIELN